MIKELISFEQFKVVSTPTLGVIICIQGKRLIYIDEYLDPIRRVRRKLRLYFPTFWARGMHDCDTGGRIHAWMPVMAWHAWDLEKKQREDWGDGPDRWSQMTLWRWLKWKRELNGNYCERV